MISDRRGALSAHHIHCCFFATRCNTLGEASAVGFLYQTAHSISFFNRFFSCRDAGDGLTCAPQGCPRDAPPASGDLARRNGLHLFAGWEFRYVLGYVLAYRPLTLDGSLVTSAGRRFFFNARPEDTVLRGGDWVHFEPLPGAAASIACAGGSPAFARIIARADQVASMCIPSRDAADLLAALTGESEAIGS